MSPRFDGTKRPHDAIQAIFSVSCRKANAPDADIAKCFDKINQKLMALTQTSPPSKKSKPVKNGLSSRAGPFSQLKVSLKQVTLFARAGNWLAWIRLESAIQITNLRKNTIPIRWALLRLHYFCRSSPVAIGHLAV